MDAVCANQQNSGVYTALWFAAHGGKRNLVAALIAAGASTSLRVEGGPDPLRPVETHYVAIRPLGDALHILWQLLRAGSPLPRIDRTKWMQPYKYNAAAADYVNAVAAAGGYVAYEKAHRAKLAAIFAPKFTWLPAEVVPTIIEFWAHFGHA